MLEKFWDKANSLFDRDFLIAYWFPVCIASLIILLIGIGFYGYRKVLILAQQDLMVSSYLFFVTIALIIITVFAYLLQPFTRQMIQFYEGYWPLTLQKWVKEFPKYGEKNIYARKKDQFNNCGPETYHAQYELFYHFPLNEELLMPTRLGNVLRAAECYSTAAYGMDINFWWPRLWQLLPAKNKKEVTESLTNFIAFLNLSSFISLISISVSIYSYYSGYRWSVLIELMIGLISAYIVYRASVSQAEDYGENIRVSVDLYRFDLLEALHQPLPNNVEAERKCWGNLLLWLYSNNPSAATNIEYSHNVNSDLISEVE